MLPNGCGAGPLSQGRLLRQSPSLAAGIAVAVVVYSLATGIALRRKMPQTESNGVVFQK